ncbi:MAG: hypothetical protein AAFV19_01500 [Pseudomonadota bacterium]
MTRFLIACLAGLAAVLPAPAEAHEPMTLERLIEIITAVDPDAQVAQTAVQFTVQDIPVVVITDPVADRMRAMVPIRSADGILPEEMQRMMQANFDTALDARYAIAKGRLWSTYIHPLGPLDKDEFLAGIGQVVNLATTYGSTYNSGLLSFGGGDSNDLNRQLIEDLLQKGEKI